MVHLSHQIFREIIVPGDIVIDATCGNGKDSVVLAQLLQGAGKLVAYDLQKKALENASALFQKCLSHKERAIIELKKTSHEKISEQGAKLIHYNLGYLPKGNKAITTLETTTKASLERAFNLVALQGLITVVSYPGHEEGEKETVTLKFLAERLDPAFWQVSLFYVMNRNKAPHLFVFQSLKKMVG
ncbi:SAM-dependent methyltransferase, MraW methylase family [Candidatus Chlamydia sanziniae]|uniref:SAM-dependent methyltransferase, MraW methylase family n=2 Tax=Candidatus Chlamydia sanziniae TaxID=1806891 RepID=A0A1A9HXX4_9CHLA|nr:SAM-dependent methyltransferase, MraW methylase family [Candidatus Chlamydia sanziniae]